MNIKIKLLKDGIKIPKRADAGSSGYDVYSPADLLIYPGERILIMTGFSLEIPEGFEGQVRSRSGLAIKNGIVVLNAPGTIDFNFRGEVGVILINHSDTTFTIEKDSRIAQLVFNKFEEIDFITSDILSETDRGEGGFGSSGVK